MNEIELPTIYTESVIKKSNLLIGAKLALAYERFSEAAELLLESAEIESQLGTMAESHGQYRSALVHFVSEMSCLGQADETSRAIKCGEQILALPYVTDRVHDFVSDYVEKLEARRLEWMRAALERSLTEYA